MSNPYHAVELPEFGASIGWTMCRNPMCPNFGIHYSGPAPNGSNSVGDGRYRIDVRLGRIACRHCGKSFKLMSNASIRPAARHFLSQSLPFADCPDEGCPNHGLNVFEHYGPDWPKARRLYHRGSAEHRVMCWACRGRFTIGAPLRFRRAGQPRAAKRDLGRIIRLGRSGLGVLEACEEIGLSIGGYYSRLHAAGDRLRDYHAWRSARLLRRSFGEWPEPVRVYTDTLMASLGRWGDTSRWQALPIAVSVVDLPQARTSHVLAVHPFHFPCEPSVSDDDDMYEDSRRPRREAEWDWVQHVYWSASGTGFASGDELPNIGTRGFFMVPPYAHLAHFLTVRKLLSRFPVVHHYMDGDKEQAAAALTALADEVRAGRWEIALHQRDEPGESREGAVDLGRWHTDPVRRTRALDRVLDGAWADAEGRWAEKRLEGGLEFGAEPDARADAKLFAKAFLAGANSKQGGWAWLEYPPAGFNRPGGRTLWLTRRFGAQYGPGMRELLRPAGTLPVDRIHNFLRTSSSALSRPAFRASPGRGYRDARKSPLALSAELWAAVAAHNFGPRRRKRDAPPRAKAMGLVDGRERPVDLGAAAWEFRLGLGEAERISRWVRE